MILLVGDIVVFILSLWLALILRSGELPSLQTFFNNLTPFLILSVVWISSFFIAGLYEKQKIAQRKRLPELLLKTQLFNSLCAVIFFYFIPYFGVAPKIILFLYIIVSFALSFFWRVYALSNLVSKRRDRAMLVAGGTDADEMIHEINNNPRYPLEIVSVINPSEFVGMDFERDILSRMKEERISNIILDSRNDSVTPLLPNLYNLIFLQIHFTDFYDLYEEIFDRLPVSILQHGWFLENISTSPKSMYDSLKRLIDIALSLLGGVLSLILYPIAFVMIWLDDGGPIFITQKRIGKGGKLIDIFKFRSMKTNDAGVWPKQEDERITRAGRLLRKSRIDELPQFWNVLKGEISLIGPRPDIVDLGKELSEKIPYYNMRNIIQPGLSGWAQINQEFPPHTLEATQIRLAYDLYYVKNRSIILDARIILKTIRTLLSRTGK